MQKPPSEVRVRITRSFTKVELTSLSPVFSLDCVTTGCTPDVTKSCVSSISTMHSTFSPDINRISQITYSTERQDYVLNMFDQMEDVDVDLEDYYDLVTNDDAQAASLTDSPEAHAYLSEVSITHVVQVCPEIIVPRTYAQAVDPGNEFHTEWRFAAERELQSLTDNRTWNLVSMPLDKRVIGSLWIFKLKRDSNGKVIKFKARVCARGDHQTYEVDYHEICVPALRYTTLRVLLSLACSLDLEI